MLTRTVITDVTFKLYVHYGVEKTTLKDVASALGVTPPSLYVYFENKGELSMAVFKKSMNAERRLIRRRCQSLESFPEFLSALVAVKFFNFKKNNRLFHSIEHIRVLGYYERLTDMRECFANYTIKDLDSSLMSDYGGSIKELKTKLKGFLLEIDSIHLENANRKTKNGATVQSVMKEIAIMLENNKINFLNKINLTTGQLREIPEN